ncbi:hypothetical protein HZU77_008785 [Neisseriaceae bacterium TC5R-5]|nr:hypothetical protein [Neisseriaceae bacterium TC5R-5]
MTSSNNPQYLTALLPALECFAAQHRGQPLNSDDARDRLRALHRECIDGQFALVTLMAKCAHHELVDQATLYRVVYVQCLLSELARECDNWTQAIKAELPLIH